jgi:hypothetical protein
MFRLGPSSAAVVAVRCSRQTQLVDQVLRRWTPPSVSERRAARAAADFSWRVRAGPAATGQVAVSVAVTLQSHGLLIRSIRHELA